MALVKGRAGALRIDLDGGSGTGQVYTITLNAANVSITTGIIKVPGSQLYTGQAVTVAGGTLPTGITAGTYYAVLVAGDASGIKLANSYANAVANPPVTITPTATGSGSMTLTTADSEYSEVNTLEWNLDLSYQKADATVLNSTVQREVKTIANGTGTLRILRDSGPSGLEAAAAAPNNDGAVSLTLIYDVTTGKGYKGPVTLFGFKTSVKPTEVQVLEIDFSFYSDIQFL
jgi:hypothetical protein